MCPPRPLRHKLSRDEKRAYRGHLVLLQRLGIISPVVFDVGAHEGTVSMAYLTQSQRLGLVPEIWAFEPAEMAYETLVREVPGLRGYRNVALGTSVGIGTLNSFTDNTVNSLLAIDQRVVAISGNYVAVPTAQVPISTLEVETGLAGSSPDLVKIDVQGSELDVLRGGETVFRGIGGHVAPALVVVEFTVAACYENQTALHELLGFMNRTGFRLWSIDRTVQAKAGNLYFGDMCFVSEASYERLGAI